MEKEGDFQKNGKELRRRTMREDKENREGFLIRRAIEEFYASRTEENLLNVLNLLMNSVIWMPCHEGVRKGEDPVGEDPASEEETRLTPDFLQKGDEYFLPVFSGTEEMGAYGDKRLKLEESFIEAIEIARNPAYQLSGIVVNAFTTPFSLSWELLDLMEESANLQ